MPGTPQVPRLSVSTPATAEPLIMSQSTSSHPAPVLPYEPNAAEIAIPVLPVDLDPALGGRAVRKVMLRLIPFMILLYIMNYLDRVNVSFAKLQMLNDLKM